MVYIVVYLPFTVDAQFFFTYFEQCLYIAFIARVEAFEYFGELRSVKNFMTNENNENNEKISYL